MSDEKKLQMTTVDICDAALEIAKEFARHIKAPVVPYLTLPLTDDLRTLTHKMILEAANPNGLMIVAKFHDEWAAKQIKAGSSLCTGDAILPFTQLPREMQAYAIFYRSAVVSLAQFWAGF